MTHQDPTTLEALIAAYEAGELDDPAELDTVEAHLRANNDACAAMVEFGALRALTQSPQAAAPTLDPSRGDDILATLHAAMRAATTPAAPAPAPQATTTAAPGPEQEILTLPEAAALLRVPLELLEEELDTLPTFEIGGAVRLRRTRLMAWINQREAQTQNNRMLRLLGD